MTVKTFQNFINESAVTDEAIRMLRTSVSGTIWDGKLHIAGGFVRDSLMGKESKDIDIVVDGNLDAGIDAATFIAKALGVYKKDSNPVIFPRFGTAKLTIYPGGHPYDVEFVAPRKEKYDGVTRKPVVSSGTLEDDAFRRDFTINTLFQNLTTGEILDLTGRGRADLQRKVIQTSGDADWIFNEDPLRILRAVRFALKYEFELPLSVIKAIKRNSDKLKKISSERINDELNKILVLKNPSRAFRLFAMTGILNQVMPEMEKLVGLKQNAFHNQDAFRHTLSVLDNTPPDLIRRLGALFHDIGKAATRTEKDGKVQFIGHQQIGAEITKEIMRRLHYPNEMIEKISAIVRYHMDLKSGGDDSMALKDKSLRKFIYRVAGNLEPLLDVIHADNISHSETHSMPNQIDRIRKRISSMDINNILNTRSLLDGNEIMALGANGKLIGEIKSRIIEKVLENPEFSKKNAIDLARNMILSRKN